ncbi:MAG: CHAD domain-containing protein [Planctomycetes bacterium]|nr:CHAD domain-containing protein [Planctomycetota bacterium]
MKPSPLLPAATWLEELARQVERLREVVEPEAVHRLRVAAGRLSVWLELGARRALRDDLRRLRRSAAAVRDLDVIAANDGGSTWADVLRDERGEEAARLRAALRSPRVEGLLDALAAVPEPDPVDVRAALQRLKRRVLRAGDALDDPADGTGALHRLRRRVRRLRYALDWMGADASELRGLQEHLGGLNDLAIELARLDVRRGDMALDARRRAVRREMDERRAAALAAWGALRPSIGEL